MKVRFLLALLLSAPLGAETLLLDEFDQIKLGELLHRLPAGVASRTIEGHDTVITYPLIPLGFQITCRRTFFNGSPYPSFTACLVGMDPNHQNRDQSHDEIRFRVTDPVQVQGLWSAIPYGKPLKEFYSWGRDAGVNYEGSPIEVFRYRFECLAESCFIRFSGKAVVVE